MALILVTGSNGQLGTELAILAGENPQHSFIFTDYGDLDITDRDALQSFLEAHKPDWIINCAAYTAVDKAETDREAAYRLNATAPGYLAEISNILNVRLIHISTDYVLGGEGRSPFTEEAELKPQGVYAASKAEGEQRVMQADPRSVIFRTAWLYSPYGHNFVKTMLRLGGEKTEINVVDDQTGSPTYAHDLARSILAAIDTNIPAGIYHYSNEGTCTWFEFAQAVMEYAGLPCRVNPIPTSAYPLPAQRPGYSVLSKEKIKATLNISIPHWRESLKKCVALLHEQS